MHKNLLIFFLVSIVGAAAGVYGYLQTITPEVADTVPTTDNGIDEPATTADSVRLSSSGSELQVLDTAGATMQSFTIGDVNAWTEANWDDVFSERPAFGEVREVNFTDFSRIDTGATLVPDGNAVIFSVNDYAVASTMSFVLVYDVNAETFSVIPHMFAGGIRSYALTTDGSTAAFLLDTARAQGDGLAVVDIENLSLLFELDGESLLTALESDREPADYMPQFTALAWIDSSTLSFETEQPDPDTDDLYAWTIDRSGDALELQ